MQRWVKFIAKHPDAHVLLGRTRNITQWRNNGLRQLINAQHSSGQFSVRRDLDDEQGYLLILIAFANEADAVKLAEVLAAKRVDAYGGYSSVFEFDPALLAAVQRRRAAALSNAAVQGRA